MYRLMRRKNESMKQQVVRFAQRLVRTAGLSLEEHPVADLIQKRMARLGFDRVLRDEAGNVIGVMFGRQSAPTLLLASHMDTVPADEDDWNFPPHSGHVANGKLHGLGSCDCKGGLAAQLFAAALLRSTLLPMRGSIIVAATVGEENGASAGIRALLGRTLPDLEMKPDYAVLGEPTSLGLYYGHEGWAEIDIRVEGANPFQVGDAADAIFTDMGERQGELAASLAEDDLRLCKPRFQRSNGMQQATISMTRRLRMVEDVNEVVGRIRHNAHLAAQGSGAVAVDVAVRQENHKLYNGRTTVVRQVRNSWATDPFHPLLERARQALAGAECPAQPGKWKLGRLGQGTAGGVLVEDYGIPTIGYGPGDEELAHAPDESVDVERLRSAVYGTAVIAQCLVGVPVFGWSADEI